MKIGLDISVVQTPHRMRGIGATAINFVNAIPQNIKDEHVFVLFLHEKDQAEALSLLKLSGLTYEIRSLRDIRHIELRVPRKLRLINSALNSAKKLYESHVGDPRVGDIGDIDAYLQFDQMQSLPKRNGHTKFGVILYDLIPYVMGNDYLWGYRAARYHGCSRKGALRKSLLRRRYVTQLSLTGKKASRLFAISAYTKKDFVKYVGTNPAKISVTHLGIDQSLSKKTPDTLPFKRYVENSWGYFPQKVILTNKPFLLFIGGADPRRKLMDLFVAYNNLKAQGKDIKLVLAGDSMQGPKALPTPELQNYAARSSYPDDIDFLGFVTDEQREWLYDHAVAMVYPSVYEGFGLPILEAMRYGTPVITYKNSSIGEISGDAVLYAHDGISIKSAVDRLMNESGLSDALKAAGQAQAAKFSWETTVENIIRGLQA